MKKSVLALAMAFGVTSAFAQDLTSKKGEPILPEAGDWAISASANPFLDYMGNFFGKTANNTAPTFNFLGNQNLIMGKYFLDEKMAIRLGVNLGFATYSTSNMIAQDNPGTIPAGTAAPMVTDKATHSTTGIGLTGGIERRKGKTRLQGYYGAELGVFFGGTHDKYTYGNSFAGTGTVAGTSATPNSTVFSTVSGGSPVVVGNGAAAMRVTDSKTNGNFQVGIRGFIGAEYFILPKISLGGEFGWAIGIAANGYSKNTTEKIYTGTSASTQEVKGPIKTSNFVIGTDNKNSFFGPTGTLRANFYF